MIATPHRENPGCAYVYVQGRNVRIPSSLSGGVQGECPTLRWTGCMLATLSTRCLVCNSHTFVDECPLWGRCGRPSETVYSFNVERWIPNTTASVGAWAYVYIGYHACCAVADVVE